MPIGSTYVYNPGDLILSTVSASGASFVETKISAATSSLILFNSDATLTSQSLNSVLIGSSSYVSGSTSIIANLTASTISASGAIIASSFTGSFSGSITNAISSSYALTSSVATSETLGTVTGRGSSTGTQITVATAGGGSMYTGRKAGVGYADILSGATFKSITDNPTGSVATSYAFASYYSGSTGINSFYVSAIGSGYFSGSVGIGNSTPIGKLDVVSVPDASGIIVRVRDTVASGTASFGGIQFASAPGTDYTIGKWTTAASAGLLQIRDQSGNQFVTINSSGNVGIGTNSPTQTLDVSGSIRIKSSGTYADPTDNAGFLNYDSIGGIFTISARSNGGNTYTAFRTSNGGAGSEKMRIANDGNVGIGTTLPAAIVDIQGTNVTLYASNYIGTPGLIYLRGNDDYNSGTAGAGIWLRGKYDSSSNVTTFGAISAIKENDIDGNYAGALTFLSRTNGQGSGAAEKMRIDSNGNVGIGTTSPGARLEISGSSNSALFNIKSPISGNIIFVTGSGCVGINKSTPTATFDISGSTIITGSLNVSTNITCLSLTETSTEAVKYNIVPLLSQLDNVLKLTPVSFNYKKNDKHSIGLIAEEVAKIYPEFTSDNNDSISYGKITSVLIQSIKELKDIIDAQQKQIEDLKHNIIKHN